MSPAGHLLVVDDDPEIGTLLGSYLSRHGFIVETAADGAGMRARLARGGIDLVVLDLMLPQEDGLSLCRELRAHSALPVIMLTAQGTLLDRVVGLEVGADDYLPKPFDPRELLARIKAVLRRAPTLASAAAEPAATPAARPEYLHFAGWRLDLRARQMRSPEGTVISLPGSDFHVLRCLAERPNQPLSRDHLLAQAFGRERAPLDRAIDVCVSRLRQHLEPDPRQPRLLRTVRHEGYMLYVDGG